MKPSSEHKQQGFSLVSAIFLLVVIAALGIFAKTLSTSQHQASAMDLMGSRAYQVAKAGIEWGTFQITQSATAGAAFITACQSGSPVPQPTMPTGTQLSGFTINLACNASPHTEGGTSLWVYQVTSTARISGASVGSLNYVERQLQISLRRDE